MIRPMFFSLATFLAWSATFVSNAGEPAAPPNIVFIMADDK